MKYDLLPTPNCARFTYHGISRVIRVIGIDKGNVTGYETRKGSKIVNARYANIRSFKIGKMEHGTLVMTKN